jgi:hypothetical protein
MTRVLFWTDAFWPQIGGVEVLSASFLPALQERGHAFAVVASQATGTARDTGEFRGTPVYRFPFHEVLAANDLGRLAEIRAQLVDLKRKFRPDLVHVNVTGPGLFFHLQTAGAHASPLLMSLLIAPPARAGADTLFGRALSSASWVTALSAAVLDPIRRAMPAIEARSSVVYAGLERLEFTLRQRPHRVLGELPLYWCNYLRSVEGGRIGHARGFLRYLQQAWELPSITQVARAMVAQAVPRLAAVLRRAAR